MKMFKQIFALAACAVSFGLGSPVPAQTFEQPADIPDETVMEPEPATTDVVASQLPPVAVVAATNEAAEFSPGQGLRFKTSGVPLETILSYLSKSAGYVIQLKPGVELKGSVDIQSEQPLSKEEAVLVVKQILAENGYTAITNGRIFTIIRSEDAPRGYTPVHLGSRPEEIPRTTEVVTQIMPVHSLNLVELVKILRPLLPGDRVPSVDESANALIMTDTQINIRRVAEIVAALDSVTSSVNTLRVFPLQYDDATAVAGLIKELFAPPAATTTNPRGAGNAVRFPGGNNPRGAGAAGNAEAASGQTPVSRVTVVADEQGNTVIVSAPEAMLPAIAKLIESVDVSVDDVTQVEAMRLRHADPQEMADLLSSLFPNQSAATDAGVSAFQFSGQGGRGVANNGARQGQGAAAGTGGPSGRLQKLGRVLAVPDPRTSTIMVSAARSLMPQIRDIVSGLDERDDGRQKVHVIQLKYADPYDVQQMLQELWPNGTTTAADSFSDALTTRRTYMLNNPATIGSGNGFGSGTSRTGGNGGT